MTDIKYSPDTLFSTFSSRFPALGARGVRVLVDAVTFQYEQDVRVGGVFLAHGGVPVVVTDCGAYVQWPHTEEKMELGDDLNWMAAGAGLPEFIPTRRWFEYAEQVFMSKVVAL